MGKLRIRLSCVWPNTVHTASLPLLGERAKGAQVVGTVSLTLQACYGSTVSRGQGGRAWLSWQWAWMVSAGRGTARAQPRRAPPSCIPAPAAPRARSAPLSCSCCRPGAARLPQKALFKGYTAPALPKAAYVHGVDGKAHQAALGRESRRIVLRCALCAPRWLAGPRQGRLPRCGRWRDGAKALTRWGFTGCCCSRSSPCSLPPPAHRWLDSANPHISNPVALMVLDAER